METYRCNRNCGCMRCRSRGIMWGVVFITLGVLLLLHELDLRGFDFGQTWPLILIVIGVVLMLQRTASIEGHVQPYTLPPAATMPSGTYQAPAPSAAPSTESGNEVRHE